MNKKDLLSKANALCARK